MENWTTGKARSAFWAGGMAAAVALTMLGRGLIDIGTVWATGHPSPVPEVARRPGGESFGPAPVEQGVLVRDARACPGYTLVAPMNATTTYLIDLQGRVVRTWKSRYFPGQSAYLLENGHLLRAARLDPEELRFAGNAQGGRVQEFTWDGELVWDFKFHDDRRLAHHDLCRMPNGNVLLVVWEMKTAEEAIANGRDTGRVYDRWLADSIVEVRPTGKSTGEVVWEWHAWDHAIQEYDPSRANYGAVADHPERIDVNFGDDGRPIAAPGMPARLATEGRQPKRGGEVEKLKSLGYVSSLAAMGNRWLLPEWNHINAVAYNAELDQVVLTPRHFSEVWVIDHGTTTAEAAGHSGGRRGKGGDLLYRWGNPAAHHAGTPADQKLFNAHDAHWVPRGHPGAGHLVVFNNGGGRADRNFSTVDELATPIDARGNYPVDPGHPFGPAEPAWSYSDPDRETFFAPIMSGADRLPNGNTLVCESLQGMIFEVTPDREVVWKYVIPFKFAPPRGNQTTGVAVFRAYRYTPDYPGLAGKDLTPGRTLNDPAGS